eukprot:GFYU01017198.1.p1 GENE.GFYU01017198.1~~GFYU01017198.1.p1  ORF type:complete len:141 (+),score=7.89 GFYU01017198.1:39-425(+)
MSAVTTHAHAHASPTPPTTSRPSATAPSFGKGRMLRYQPMYAGKNDKGDAKHKHEDKNQTAEAPVLADGTPVTEELVEGLAKRIARLHAQSQGKKGEKPDPAQRSLKDVQTIYRKGNKRPRTKVTPRR